MKKVLLIEDNSDLSAIIKFNLIKQGYEVFSVDNANDALMILDDIETDIILLDLMLPGVSGEEFLRIVKSSERIKHIPIIIISAKNLENDVINGLKLGADDYLTKPYSIKVLLAKVEAVLRRTPVTSAKLLLYKGIEINRESYSATVDGKNLTLTKKEFELLSLFMENRNKVFSREMLLNRVWGYSAEVYTRTVDAHISSLRKKLGKKGKFLKSIPKVGYVFE